MELGAPMHFHMELGGQQMDGIGFLGIFVALLGAACLYWGWSIHARSAAMKAAAARWPMTAGTIMSAAVERQGQTPRGTYYVPSVSYHYAVNGQPFVGNRIRFGFMGTQSHAAAERMIAAYPVGATGMLRYDPQNPQESVLEPDKITSNMLITAIAGGVLLLLGLGIVAVAVQGGFEDSGRTPSYSGTGMNSGYGTGAPGNGAGMGGYAPPASAAMATQPRPIGDMDRAWIAGLWSNDANCATTMELLSDGNLIGANGSRGSWYLGAPGSGTLVLRTAAGTGVVQAEWAGQNELRLTYPGDRRTLDMIRCVR